jgi:hypothetical protein
MVTPRCGDVRNSLKGGISLPRLPFGELRQ